MKTINASMIGLGKLGMPCAEAMASHYNVTGYDIYPKTSDKINIAPEIWGAVKGQDIIFVAVQTPHDAAYDGSTPIAHLPNKDFDYETVKEVLYQINQVALSHQIVVLISTVLPGTVRRELQPLIYNAKFIYNPYLIAMGSVAWDMVNPEMVIIGTEDGSLTGDAKTLIDFYKPIMQNDPRYEVGTWDEAECIKVFYNTYISAKIGLANMIQDVAIKQGNINVDVVTTALAKSSMRIMGPKYMTAGMGDAGPCHPRDNIALRYMAEKLDLGYDLFDAIMNAREIQAQNLAMFLVDTAIANGDLPIYIHGKAYKPNVAYCEGSYSLLVGHYVEKMLKKPIYIDPLTMDLVNGPVVGVVLMAHNANVTYGYAGGQKQGVYCDIHDGSVVVDPWRTYETTNKNIKVIHYGNTRIKQV
jgi:UDPglucose 6-dehydrogenase